MTRAHVSKMSMNSLMSRAKRACAGSAPPGRAPWRMLSGRSPRSSAAPRVGAPRADPGVSQLWRDSRTRSFTQGRSYQSLWNSCSCISILYLLRCAAYSCCTTASLACCVLPPAPDKLGGPPKSLVSGVHGRSRRLSLGPVMFPRDDRTSTGFRKSTFGVRGDAKDI